MFNNPIKLLRDLLPEPALQVGTVVSVDGGVATIELPGGARVQARGEAADGTRVYFRNNLIESTAPNLQIEVIEI